MSITLSQSAAASFPDRGSTGLLITAATGNDGAHLQHDLVVSQTVLYMRALMHPNTLAGGQLILFGGFDADDAEVFRVTYDADARDLTVTLSTGDTLSATLQSPIRWHCVELKLDASAGEAELWINGIWVDTATGSFSALTTRKLQIGGLAKDTNTTGQLYLDEWVMATDYIGPVVVEPTADHAGEPARWLVIYNTADSDSVTWAENYRQARTIPFANLLGTNLPTTESINAAQFAALDSAINDYLSTNGLTEHVMGILCGFKVPGNVDFAGAGIIDSVPSLLHMASSIPGSASNPHATDALPTRPTVTALGNLRLTARIDAPDLSTANDMVTRATALIGADLGDGATSTIWLDPYTTPGPLSDPIIASMVNWSSSLDRMRTRLPIELSSETDPQQDVQFDKIDRDGFFWGWSTATVPSGFFAAPAGTRVFCLQLHAASATAPTLRDDPPTNWVDTAIDAGYAAAVGSVYPYSLSAAPFARPFFEALRQGWTLAEAWFVALPVVRDALFLTGDPLMTVAMPREGWDIWGPVELLEHIDVQTPSLALREPDRSVSLSVALQPSAGTDGVYLIRRLDALGRSEGGTRAVRVANIAGSATAMPLAPTWPDVENWRVHVEDGNVTVTILWDRPLRATRVSLLELEGQIDDGPTQTLASLTLDPAAHQVQSTSALPTISARYRWRMTTEGNATMTTPWSAVIRPVSAPSIALQSVEIGS